MQQTAIATARLYTIVVPLLACLPAAAASPSPPTALLPLLSPILRQRVQLLSGANSEPWLQLLCYDASNASKLDTIVKNERFEPHPISGEVEVDWDDETQLQYRRVDEETLQALISLKGLGLTVRLIWCVNDEAGGGDGWRIGEVGVFDGIDSTWGEITVSAAEACFDSSSRHPSAPSTNGHKADEYEDDDDDYWAQYDKTPGHTPAPKHSPGPQAPGSISNDEDYYAQYASVQPAMDNHDPDEAQEQGNIESSLGRDDITHELQFSIATHSELNGTSNAWSENTSNHHISSRLAQPRPTSSAGSSGSETVERLEKKAEDAASIGSSEIGIKQHISTSIKSLYRLAKVAGIQRNEFERLVRTELDVLSLMDEHDE